MRLLRRGMLAALALAGAVHAGPPEASWHRLAAQGTAASEDRRPRAALEALSAAIADPGFASAPSNERHAVLRLAADVAFELRQWREALGFFQRAAALPDGSANDLHGAFDAANNLGDRRGAVLALTAVLREAPASLREEDEAAVWQTFQKARELLPGDGARFQLLDAAFQAHYRTNLGEVLGPVWIDLAVLLQARGDGAKAARVIAEVDRPSDLIDVRADNRFASLVDAQPARYDVAAAARRRVDRMQAAVARKPRSLEALIAFAEAHKDEGQPARALAVIDRAVARVASPGAFDDQERFENWLHDERSRVLWRLGLREESVVELERGMATPEDRSSNISQLINLAQRYAAMDRPELALKTLDRMEREPSAYGLMAREYARLAAADELGDEAAMQSSLTFLRGHEADAPRILRAGLVLAGLLEEAARVFIGELDDPIFRSLALHEVQEFDDGGAPGRLTPARWDTYWKRLLARPDVKAAIAKYGRIQRYTLPPQ